MFKKFFNFEASRYLLSGITTFIIENISFSLIFYGTGKRLVLANVMSIAISGCYNFILSKFFVFNKTKNMGRTEIQLALYISIVIINTLVSTLLISGLVGRGFNPYIIKPLVTLLIVLWTFFIYKFVIFKRERTGK